jgi:hypothetical protein
MVSQDTSLLHRSVRDNIAYGRPDATEDEIIEAARKANALDFIAGLEDLAGRTGFDAHVGERGVKLSGGQRQRIAIARVFLKDAPILVLDEATSALDSEVEAAIQENLFALMENKTVIAIAHRLSTIAQMDRLVVLDQGEIVETGVHDDLIKSGGIYADLWSRQSGGFIDAAARTRRSRRVILLPNHTTPYCCGMIFKPFSTFSNAGSIRLSGVEDYRPPSSTLGFLRHYVGQAKGAFAAMLALGGLVALLEAALFYFVGRLVDVLDVGRAIGGLGRVDWGAWPDAGLHAVRGGGPVCGGHAGRSGRGTDGGAGVLQPGALAGAFACVAPGSELFPERFRRPDRQQGLDRGAGDRRFHGLAAAGGVVHLHLHADHHGAGGAARLAAVGAGAGLGHCLRLCWRGISCRGSAAMPAPVRKPRQC